MRATMTWRVTSCPCIKVAKKSCGHTGLCALSDHLARPYIPVLFHLCSVRWWILSSLESCPHPRDYLYGWNKRSACPYGAAATAEVGAKWVRVADSFLRCRYFFLLMTIGILEARVFIIADFLRFSPSHSVCRRYGGWSRSYGGRSRSYGGRSRRYRGRSRSYGGRSRSKRSWSCIYRLHLLRFSVTKGIMILISLVWEDIDTNSSLATTAVIFLCAVVCW